MVRFFFSQISHEKLRNHCTRRQLIFSNMSEPAPTTSLPVYTIKQLSNSEKIIERSTVKCKWKTWEINHKRDIKSLPFHAIKQQIGDCTLCAHTPSPDLIQLPKCQCFFCKDCFLKYLNNFAVPRAVLHKEIVSIDFFKRKKKENNCRRLFDGMFDADDLSFEGDVLPKPIKPPLLKSTSCLEDRNVRQKRHEKDKELYRLVKVEEFHCPNCHTFYDSFNRLDLSRNRVVSDILTLMNEDSSLAYERCSDTLLTSDK